MKMMIDLTGAVIEPRAPPSPFREWLFNQHFSSMSIRIGFKCIHILTFWLFSGIFLGPLPVRAGEPVFDFFEYGERFLPFPKESSDMQQATQKRHSTAVVRIPMMVIADPKPVAVQTAEAAPVSETRKKPEVIVGQRPQIVGPAVPDFAFGPELFPKVFSATAETLPGLINGLERLPIGWLNAYVSCQRLPYKWQPPVFGLERPEPIMARREPKGFVNGMLAEKQTIGVNHRVDWNPATHYMRPVFTIEARRDFGDDLHLVVVNTPEAHVGIVEGMVVQWWQENAYGSPDYRDGRFSLEDCQVAMSPRIRIPNALVRPTFIVICDPSAK
jgi:hypothetical protein